MANTFVAIATVTVGSGGAASMDFTNIPATYTDLLIKVSGRSNQANLGNTVIIKFNGSTSNQTAVLLEGSGAAVSSFTQNAGNIGNIQGSTSTSDTFSSLEVYIPNYAGSTYKSRSVDSVTENNATTAYSVLAAGLWSQTAAITSIDIAIGNFVEYSTATLYGIKNS